MGCGTFHKGKPYWNGETSVPEAWVRGTAETGGNWTLAFRSEADVGQRLLTGGMDDGLGRLMIYVPAGRAGSSC